MTSEELVNTLVGYTVGTCSGYAAPQFAEVRAELLRRLAEGERAEAELKELKSYQHRPGQQYVAAD